MKIVFLDIDGVLFSGRALYLPENEHIRAWHRENDHATDARTVAATARFDPCAVSLVNRLCDTTGAKLVIHSNWRRMMGSTALKDKLAEQGLHPHNLHDDWFCGMRLSSSKSHDIFGWLSDHRLTPEPDRPLYSGVNRQVPLADEERQAQEDEFEKALANFGFDAVAIDDELLTAPVDQVTPAFEHGFGLSDYRLACALLGGEDPALGILALSSEDSERLTQAFGGNRLDMYEWLCRPNGDATRLERLRPRSDSPSDKAMRDEVLSELATRLPQGKIRT